MPTLTITLPKLHNGQAEAKRSIARFNVICCGRRWGKTVLGIDRLIEPALYGYPVGWFSPTYKMLSDVWREMRNTLEPVTINASTQEKRLELITKGVIDMWSLDNPDSARGRKYKRIVIDEAAIVPKLSEAWQNVIRPTLTDYQGDAWFLSTPKGHNYFKLLFDYGRDSAYTDWTSWQMPTSSNPFIDTSEIEAARRELPERVFLQEYLAQFIEDGSIFRRIPESAIATEQSGPIPGHSYVMGVDWGKHEDFTVFTIIDATLNEVAAIDRSNQVDYSLQVGRLQVLYDTFRPDLIVVEQNAMGEPIIEQLYSLDLPIQPFTTTQASKTNIIEGLALAFERGLLKILPDDTLISELQAYEVTRLPGGGFRYSAPSGYHDDMVMSLALAWSAIENAMTIVIAGAKR